MKRLRLYDAQDWFFDSGFTQVEAMERKFFKAKKCMPKNPCFACKFFNNAQPISIQQYRLLITNPHEEATTL